MRFSPYKITDEDLSADWPNLANRRPHCTVHETLKASMRPGFNTVIVRLARPSLRTSAHVNRGALTVADHLIVNYSFSQAVEKLQGRDSHGFGAFASANCACKSKSQVVTNSPLRPMAMCSLEQSGYGIHSIVPQAPFLGLALMGRTMLNDQGEWQEVSQPMTLYDTKPALYASSCCFQATVAARRSLFPPNSL